MRYEILNVKKGHEFFETFGKYNDVKIKSTKKLKIN
jgi:hypothetical protein